MSKVGRNEASVVSSEKPYLLSFSLQLVEQGTMPDKKHNVYAFFNTHRLTYCNQNLKKWDRFFNKKPLFCARSKSIYCPINNDICKPPPSTNRATDVKMSKTDGKRSKPEQRRFTTGSSLQQKAPAKNGSKRTFHSSRLIGTALTSIPSRLLLPLQTETQRRKNLDYVSVHWKRKAGRVQHRMKKQEGCSSGKTTKMLLSRARYQHSQSRFSRDKNKDSV